MAAQFEQKLGMVRKAIAVFAASMMGTRAAAASGFAPRARLDTGFVSASGEISIVWARRRSGLLGDEAPVGQWTSASWALRRWRYREPRGWAGITKKCAGISVGDGLQI